MPDPVSDLSPYVAAFLTGIMVFTSIFGFFRFFDTITSPALKRDLAALIRKAATALPFDMAGWIAAFQALMDGFYGLRWLSLRAILWTTLISSTICAIITAFAWLTVGHVADWDEAWFGFFFVLFVVNVPADLLSVIKTRLLLQRSPPQGIGTLLRLLVLDAALTVAIFFVMVYGLSAAMILAEYAVLGGELRLIFPAPADFLSLRAEPDIALGVFFYTTFFTTVWMAVFVSGGLIIHAAQVMKLSVTYLLDVDGKPMTSIGVVLAAPACLMVWVYGLASIALA